MIFFYGCSSIYRIEMNDDEINELKTIILETESLIKKIDILDVYKHKEMDYIYPIFTLNDTVISMAYTKVNYDSNDSIREGRKNPNAQDYIDTCKYMPGLTIHEWNLLKDDLKKLVRYGIKNNNVAYYNDGKIRFFYYKYIQSKDLEYGDFGYLAFLSEKIIRERDFKTRFQIMDQKDDLYLIKLVR
jgi:transcription-repair coupling factor (superfamily II helicase)